MTSRIIIFQSFRLCCSLLLLFGQACSSSTVRLNPDAASQGFPRQAVLLPAMLGDGINRERAQYIRQLVRSELASKNYLLLADEYLLRTCPELPCDTAALATAYGLEGSFALSVDSILRTNFLAGYVNSISGRLRLHTTDGSELINVKEVTTEQGGLVFNSGQVFEGLKSTAANAAADNFQPLAARFAERLAAKVPVPQSDATARAALHDFAPEVRSRLIRPELFEICAAAPEGLLAEILFNNTRANLRPTGRGTYCGNFLLPASSLAHTKLIFELRSPFGASLQKPIQLGAYETKK